MKTYLVVWTVRDDPGYAVVGAYSTGAAVAAVMPFRAKLIGVTLLASVVAAPLAVSQRFGERA